MLKVGDIVRLTNDDVAGIIIEYAPNQKTLIDSMFPYHIHLLEGDSDWFGAACLELVSSSP